MKERLLPYLVCPGCAADLDLTVDESQGREIVRGGLRCRRGCGVYPIVRGVPRLLAGAIAADQAATAAAFGWEWQEFYRLHDDSRYREQFLDWIHPLGPADFAGKVVLDAGCGMGRFALVSSRFGARDVIAVDLSDAVEAAAVNLAGIDNAHVVQADLHRLPLRRRPEAAALDLAYSIGVLHHLPDPERGFHALVPHLRPGGAVFAWVYGRENNGWIVHLVNPLRERVFSRLPRRLLYALSWLAALPLQAVLKLVYGPTAPSHRREALAGINRRLPYRGYLNWLSQFGLRHNHHVVFDHLVAPTAFYLRRDEFAAWFARDGLVDVRLSARNDNSWRGYGKLPSGA